LLPTYASIGIAAPILLLVWPHAPGLGAGAEYSGAILFASEYSATNKGFFASWPPAATEPRHRPVSRVVALFALMPDDQFLAWGWRNPVPVEPARRRRRLFRAPPDHGDAGIHRGETIRPGSPGGLRGTRGATIRAACWWPWVVNVAPSIGYVYTVYALGLHDQDARRAAGHGPSPR